MCRLHLLFVACVLPLFGPQEPVQPEIPKRSDIHTWTDDTGNHRREAKFLKLDGDLVHLVESNGHEISLPFERLGQFDQNLVRCFSHPRQNLGCEVLLGGVTDVLDGDTVHFRTVFGNTVTVRLVDIDAPEADQPFGLDATNELRRITLNVPAITKQCAPMAVEWKATDRYGRILGTIYINGYDVNESMVRGGLAWNFVEYSTRNDLEHVEAEARKQKIGLWQNEAPESPWDYRDRIAWEREEKKAMLDVARQPANLMDATASDPIVYITKSGKKYHAKECQHLSKSAIPIRLSRARSAYDACEHCDPPH